MGAEKDWFSQESLSNPFVAECSIKSEDTISHSSTASYDAELVEKQPKTYGRR